MGIVREWHHRYPVSTAIPDVRTYATENPAAPPSVKASQRAGMVCPRAYFKANGAVPAAKAAVRTWSSCVMLSTVLVNDGLVDMLKGSREGKGEGAW